MKFFSVIELCESLDAERTSAFSRRKTKIEACKNRACFKLLHVEGGNIWTFMADIYDGHDIKRELAEMHKVLDERVRKGKVVMEDSWNKITGI